MPEKDKQSDELVEAEVINSGGLSGTKNKDKTKNDKEKSFIKEVPLKKALVLHPFSGIMILFLDYAFFMSGELFILLPLACLLAFITAFAGVYLIQRNIEEESRGRSLAKAFFCAVITAIPTPLFGTVFASLILAVSGLNWLSRFFNPPERK
jgi:hypothetical protein